MKILGFDYELKRVSGDYDQGNMGACQLDKNIIIISDGIPKQRQASTLLHEIIEVLNDSFELNFEHKVISQLEAGLYQVLVDNGVDLTPLLKELE